MCCSVHTEIWFCLIWPSITMETGVRLGGSYWLSDLAPLFWDPLPLITDPALHNWDPAPFCWDPPLCTVYIWVFFSMHDVFVKDVVLHGHFVNYICPCLVWIDVASVKHYLTAIKVKQGALNAENPGRWSRTPSLLSALRARASTLQASRL